MPNDQYKLGELLGRGGMGQVHIARHRSGRVVAIKRVRDTLSSDRLVIDRLSDEARLLRTVSHPNVVRALDHGTSADGMPFLVMDRAYGTPLHQLIAQHGWLPIERTVAIAAQLFGGLTAIHAAGGATVGWERLVPQVTQIVGTPTRRGSSWSAAAANELRRAASIAPLPPFEEAPQQLIDLR